MQIEKPAKSFWPSLSRAKTGKIEKTPSGNDQLAFNFKAIRFTCILFFAFSSFLNYRDDLTYSFYITASCCLLLVASVYLINISRLNFLRYFFIVLFNIVIFWLSYAEGLASGDYLYLFALLLICIFICDFKNSISLITCYSITLITLVLLLILAPVHSSVQRMSDQTERSTFFLNILSSSLIVCVVSYWLLRQNYLNAKGLAEKQHFLDAVYNTSLDAVFIADIGTNQITNCNLQSLKLFNVSSDGLLKNKPPDILFKNFAESDAAEALRNHDQSWQGDLICLTSAGAEFPGYVSIVPLVYNEALLKKINILDISNIKKAEAELVIAKDKAESAMNAKSRFLSNMSHELRTPLNGIIGTANLLMDETSMPEQREHFSLLKYSSEHMLSLINDVLDFSKIEAGKMDLEKSPFNLKELFGKINNLFAAQFAAKGITIEFNADDKLDRYFMGDETRLSQVLSNLIANALKFTEKGKVNVTAHMVRSSSKTATISFSVKDTGIGITEQQQKIIFYSFTQGDTTTTRKFGGTGLGLSISKHIIELYKGELKVESAKGRGSNFFFTIQLDLQMENKSFVNEKVLHTLVSLKNMRVLIAEDNTINMLIAKRFLHKWDITTEEAVNGIEALEKFAINHFDILLIDLEMPEMDGYKTIAEIRKRNASIPVVAFTAAVYDNMQADLISHGFTDYIQKPFRPEDLHKKLSLYAKAKMPL
jgi:signal transduction histidine kinase/CheY-like chemotaxis protein